MEESDLGNGPASSKYEYILNWISGDSITSSQGWTDGDNTLDDRQSNTSTVELSDSGIDDVPQSRWLKLKM